MFESFVGYFRFGDRRDKHRAEVEAALRQIADAEDAAGDAHRAWHEERYWGAHTLIFADDHRKPDHRVAFVSKKSGRVHFRNLTH